MPIAFVASTKRVNNDGGTTAAINTTGATLLVAVGAYFGVSGGGPGISISDSFGNTWTALTERGPAGTRNCRIWYAVNPTVGAGHTFTVTGTDSFASVFFSAWSGVVTTSPLDQNTGRNSTDGAGAYSGAVNPTEGNELVIAGWCHSSTGATASAASGWTLGDHNVATSGADGNFGGGFSYQIQTTATNIADLTQVAVLSTSETTVSATATFKAAAGAPVITGPTGAAGAASITHSVNENQNNAGTWSATGGTSWSLSGTDAALLSISSGGVVTLASGNFDHEAKASYSFNVLRDAVAQAVTLNITDQAEAPLAPTIGTATAGDAQATVTFTPPNNTGRPPITSYRVTSTPGGLFADGAASPITVTGLTNGVSYTFSVTATNDEGTGPASAQSNSVTPTPGGTAPTITVQPSNQTVTAGATATFSVTATGSGLTYQWRRNGTPIGGATSSSYTTPATTVSGGSANSGDVYSVVVTGDTAPAATSSNATLTVNAPAPPPPPPPPPSGPTLPAVATDATGSARRLNQTTRMVVEPFTNIESLGTGTRTIATGTTDATTGEITLTGLAAGTYAVFGFFPSTGATINGVRFRLVTVT